MKDREGVYNNRFLHDVLNLVKEHMGDEFMTAQAERNSGEYAHQDKKPRPTPTPGVGALGGGSKSNHATKSHTSSHPSKGKGHVRVDCF